MTLDRNALEAAWLAHDNACPGGHWKKQERMAAGITAYLAALPEPVPAEVEGLCERLEADDMFNNRGPDYEPLRIPASSLRKEAAATIRALAAENGRLKRLVPSERWYWPEDDTSSDACADNPREALEYLNPGDIGAYSCGGVAYTNYYGWLPAADDADSDNDFEVDETTREAAEGKMAAEVARRTLAEGEG